MFDEIRVYEGIAERTGTIVDRDTVRGSKSVCHSVSELSRKYRLAPSTAALLSQTLAASQRLDGAVRRGALTSAS